MDVKRQLVADAHYMVGRLQGMAVVPPPHWTAERIEIYERILSDPHERQAMLRWMLEGAARLTAADDAEHAEFDRGGADAHPDEA